jgi:hypothetical protein
MFDIFYYTPYLVDSFKNDRLGNRPREEWDVEESCIRNGANEGRNLACD